MKTYTLKFSVAIVEGTGDGYDPAKPVSFNVTERLPTDIDAERYTRQRIAEELKRHFGALTQLIDNISDEKRDAADPLAD